MNSLSVYLRESAVTSTPFTPAPLGTRLACRVIVTDSCCTTPAVPITETSSIDAIMRALASRFSARRVADDSGMFSPLTPRFWFSPMASSGRITSNVSPLSAAESRVARFESGFLNSSLAWFCTTRSA